VQFTVVDEPSGRGTVTDAGAFAADSETTPVPVPPPGSPVLVSPPW